jgi:hypothetical protein
MSEVFFKAMTEAEYRITGALYRARGFKAHDSGHRSIAA